MRTDKSAYQRIKREPTITGPSYAYRGIPIKDFDGSCRVRVVFGGKVCTADVMISTSETEPIIRQDIINGLSLVITGAPAGTSVNAEGVPIGISLEVDKVHAPMPLPAQHPSCAPEVNSCSAIVMEFPGLTLPKLGHYPNFQHCIEQQPSTVPVATRMWPVLLALHAKVNEAVRELDH